MPILYEKGPSSPAGGSVGAGALGGSVNAGGKASGNVSAGPSSGRKIGGSVNAGPKGKKAPKSNNSSRESAVARRMNRNAGGGNGGGSGKNGGGKTPSTAPAKPAAPAKPVALPTFDQWAMKDSAYQQALAEYNLQISNQQNEHDTNISAARQDETNQTGDWQTQFERGQQGLLDDFAARGLGNSGLYADASQKYVSDQEAQKQSIMDAILRRIQGADSQLTGDKTASDNWLQEQKLAAAQRGAGKFSGTV